jgi:hypothetical protein
MEGNLWKTMSPVSAQKEMTQGLSQGKRWLSSWHQLHCIQPRIMKFELKSPAVVGNSTLHVNLQLEQQDRTISRTWNQP